MKLLAIVSLMSLATAGSTLLTSCADGQVEAPSAPSAQAGENNPANNGGNSNSLPDDNQSTNAGGPAGGGGNPLPLDDGEPVGTGSFTLAWDAPTTNADDTPLTDLAGYRIYRRSSGLPFEWVKDVGPSPTQAMLDFAAGTYEVVVTAYDLSGNESAYSDALMVMR